MNVYVMRHGETIWNKRGITQGRSNNKLSEDGKKQALNSAESLKDKKIDYIISSPLHRTIETSNIVNRFHHVKIIRDTRIIEIDQGVFTGRKRSTLSEEEIKIKNRRDQNYGMESMDDVVSRCKDFYEYLLSEYRDKNILVVTHNVVASVLELLAKGVKDISEEKDNVKSFKNAEVKKIL